MKYDVVVVGAGFYGCMIALDQRKQGKSVLLVEQQDHILTQASFKNQARIHNGYHYPRSLQTAISSHRNYQRFCDDFAGAIENNHLMLYAIAEDSKTSVDEFTQVCKQVNIPLIPAPSSLYSLFNLDFIKTVFIVEENVFDAEIVRDYIREKLIVYGIEVKLNTSVLGVEKHRVWLNDQVIDAGHIIVCAYAGINTILESSKLRNIPFKIEDTRMPVVAVPEELLDKGITIMDGDFFALMPYPPLSPSHTLHHVKYTPDPTVQFPQMYTDIGRYVPSLQKARLLGSIRQQKVIFEEDEATDARPIMYRKDYAGIQGLDIVLGSKIDNVYDVLEYMHNPDAMGLNIV